MFPASRRRRGGYSTEVATLWADRSMTRSEKLELLIVVNIAITVAAIFYSRRPYGGFFMAISIGFINNSIAHSTGNLLLYSSIDTSTISGDQLYMYAFHILSGISFETMQRLPVNQVFIALALYCLGRRLTSLGGAFAAISVAPVVSTLFLLNTAYEVGNMSFFVKGAGTFLYLLFLLLLLKYHSARSPQTLAGLLILFVANSFFDYTAQVWMIVTVIPFVVFGMTRKKDERALRLWNVFVLMVVVFLAYRSIIYTAYVPWIGQVLISSSIQSFVHTLPFFQDVTAYPFQGGRPFAPIVFIANAVTFAVTLSVTGYYVLRFAWSRVRRRPASIEDLTFVALFLPFPLTVAIYLPIGHVNLSYATLILPLTSAYCIWVLVRERPRRAAREGWKLPQLRSGAVLTLLLGALLTLGSISYVGAVQSGTLLVSSNSDMSAGAHWLFETTSGKIQVMSDLDTLGKLLISRSSFSAGSYNNLSLRYYSPQTYANLVRPTTSSNSSVSPIYIVVDTQTANPVGSVGWETFEPLSKHLPDLQGNTGLSLVYDDGSCLIGVWDQG